jgi:hypothetical protein
LAEEHCINGESIPPFLLDDLKTPVEEGIEGFVRG